MEFEKRRVITIKVLEPAHETLMRQWEINCNSQILDKYLKRPGLRDNQELNQLMVVLFGEWESLLRTKYFVATDPGELERIEMVLIRNSLKERGKSWKSAFPLVITGKTLKERKEKIIDGIMDNDLLYVYSEKLKLNIKQLTALTIYVLKLHADLSNTIICSILNTLRMDADFIPDKNGPGRIRMRWKDYQDPNSHARRHYKALRDHALK